MRTRLILLGVFLSLAAGLIWLELKHFSRSTITTANNEQQSFVVVATHELRSGHRLIAGDLELVRWPKTLADTLPEIVGFDATSEAPPATFLADLMGRIISQPIPAHWPLSGTALLKAGANNILSAKLAGDARAFSIPAASFLGAVHGIRSGDHVDILLTQIHAGNTVSPARHIMGDTILRDVGVLAIDDDNSSGPSNKSASAGNPDAPGAHIITFEVSASDATRLAVATELGKLSLSLRQITPEQDIGSSLAQTAPLPNTLWAGDVAPSLNFSAPMPTKQVRTEPRVIEIMRGGTQQEEKLAAIAAPAASPPLSTP